MVAACPSRHRARERWGYGDAESGLAVLRAPCAAPPPQPPSRRLDDTPEPGGFRCRAQRSYGWPRGWGSLLGRAGAALSGFCRGRNRRHETPAKPTRATAGCAPGRFLIASGARAREEPHPYRTTQNRSLTARPLPEGGARRRQQLTLTSHPSPHVRSRRDRTHDPTHAWRTTGGRTTSAVRGPA